MQMCRLAEYTDEEEFGCRVGVEGTGDEEVWDRDPVGCFHPFGRQAGEGGAGYGLADVDVYYCCEDDFMYEEGEVLVGLVLL